MNRAAEASDDGGVGAGAMLRRAEIEGARLGAAGRAVSLAGVAVLLWFLLPVAAWLYYVVLIVGFLASSVGQYLAVRRSAAFWVPYVFVAFDFLLLAFTLLFPNPGFEDPWPRQFVFRNGVQV